MSQDATIQQGFDDVQREVAADLYDAAFGAKLCIAIPDTQCRLAVLRQGFEPSSSFVAMSGGRVVGIAGFKTAQGAFTGGITFGLLKRVLGLAGALRAGVVLSLFDRACVRGQLLMDGIAVSPSMRGSGIGTRLLHRLIEHAREQGYRSIRLDVIDTNPAARRLYERVGFKAIKTERFAELKWLLGFEAATQMEYPLHPKA